MPVGDSKLPGQAPTPAWPPFQRRGHPTHPLCSECTPSLYPGLFSPPLHHALQAGWGGQGCPVPGTVLPRNRLLMNMTLYFLLPHLPQAVSSPAVPSLFVHLPRSDRFSRSCHLPSVKPPVTHHSRPQGSAHSPLLCLRPRSTWDRTPLLITGPLMTEGRFKADFSAPCSF